MTRQARVNQGDHFIEAARHATVAALSLRLCTDTRPGHFGSLVLRYVLALCAQVTILSQLRSSCSQVTAPYVIHAQIRS